MSQTKIIQVGTGGFGLSWLELLNHHDQIEVVGIVDVDKANLLEAEKVLEGKEVAYFENHVEAFQNLEADVAVIVTPPQTHKNIAMAALEHDLHVFMEKPIAHNLEDAVALHEFAKDYSKHVMISQNYRYRPVIQALKNAVDQQLAGPIEYVEWNFRRATKFGGWRDHYDEILIEDMSIHHFDMMRYLLGKNATTVYAKSMRPSWSWFNGNPTASITMTFEGILVNYFGSWVTSGPETSWNGDVKLYGEKGVITLIADRPVFIDAEGKETNLSIPEMEDSDRAYSITELIQAIKENRTPATAIADNLHSFKIVSASLESLKTGSEVPLNKYS